MKELKLQDHALLWLALGAGLLGLAAVKDLFTALVKLPAHLWNAILVVGVALTVLGIVLGAASILLKAREPAEVIFERVSFRRQEQPHILALARPSDLPKLREQYVKWFGDDVASVDTMRSWLCRCESSLILVYSETTLPDLNFSTKLVGSFKLLPITEEAVTELERGRVTGSSFKPEHISAAGDVPAAYYVGDLFAEEPARAAVLFYLDSRCRELVHRGCKIYARPFTPEGRRVMMKRGFVQVSNGSEKLEMRQLCRLDSPPSAFRPLSTAGQNTESWIRGSANLPNSPKSN